MLNYLKRKLPHNLKIRKTFGIIKGFFAYLKNFGVLNGVQVIGITGTDGKTSTTIFTAQLFQNLGIKTAAMSSELYFVNGKFSENKSKRTTASPFEIYKFIKNAKLQGVKIIILEVSSHSLEQGRLFGINFDYSVITNLSQEHLDYHGTMENYAKTKAKIISKTKKSVFFPKKILQKNIFEEKIFSRNKNFFRKNKKFFLDEKIFLEKIETFLGEGLMNKKIIIGNNLKNFDEKGKTGIKFDLNYLGKNIKNINFNILGDYNVENLLFGIALLDKLKFNIFQNNGEDLKNSVSKISAIPGRLDELDFGQDFKIWISFAVTPNAIEKLLKYAQLLVNSAKSGIKNKGKVFLVFGATGGQHDHGKRPIMGEIAGNGADFSVLTDDETYGEDSMKIISEVENGFKKVKNVDGKYKIIQDRGEAIEFALKNAKKGDIVIISGMGTFESRNVGGIEEKWSDEEVCRKFLKK